MKTRLLLSTFLMCSFCADAADPEAQPEVNRFTLGARLPFNISAKFDYRGGYLPGTNPGAPIGGGINRNYDDGYVRVDADGNAQDLTWYWGYRDVAQVPGNDTLLQHASKLGSASTREYANDPQAGVELAWLREIKRGDFASIGFKFAFNYLNINITDRHVVSPSVRRLTDTYSLGGILPPAGGSPWQYAATFDQGLNGPAPIIDDHPVTRDFSFNGSANISGHRTIDDDIFGFKIGPWIEIPLTRRISFQTGGGIAWGISSGNFRFHEIATLPDSSTRTLNGSNDSVDAFVGGYIDAGFNLGLTKHLGLFLQGEYQHLSDFSQRTGNHSVTLDLGQTWSLNTGIIFSF